ncbi:SdpI family protein [Treponema sp.]
MKINKIDALVGGLGLLSFTTLAVFVYPRLPETIPVHWNFKSEVDGWGPRWTIHLLSALPLAMYLLLRVVPRIDPRKEAYKKHEKPYAILSAAISLFLLPIVWISALAAMGLAIDVGILVRILVGALFIVIGNLLGKFRPNYFVGIRTPWTLADGEVWRKTHRRGAWVFIIMGAIMLLSLSVPHSAIAGGIAIASIIGGVVYLFLYSYLEFRKR